MQTLNLRITEPSGITLSMLDDAIASFILGKAVCKDNVTVRVLKKLRQVDKEWLVHWYNDKLYGLVPRPRAWDWSPCILLPKPVCTATKVARSNLDQQESDPSPLVPSLHVCMTNFCWIFFAFGFHN